MRCSRKFDVLYDPHALRNAMRILNEMNDMKC